MTSRPKPRAAERKLANYERKHQLRLWRHTQYKIVWDRSGGICEICRKRVVNDIHHCYSRGKDMNDWREQANVMLATCRQCHPPAIKHKPAGPKLAWVEEILEEVNQQHRAATAAAGGSEI